MKVYYYMSLHKFSGTFILTMLALAFVYCVTRIYIYTIHAYTYRLWGYRFSRILGRLLQGNNLFYFMSQTATVSFC